MEPRLEAVLRAARLLRALTTAAQIYAHHARVDLHMHRSDLTALGLLSQASTEGHLMTAGELSDSLGLTPSATTALIDRLQGVGHVRRERDPADGRKVVLSMTESAQASGRQAFGPLQHAVAQELARFSPEQLDAASEVMAAMLQGTEAAIRSLDDPTQPADG